MRPRSSCTPYLPFQDAFEEYFKIDTKPKTANLGIQRASTGTGLLGWLRGPTERSRPGSDPRMEPERILYAALEFLREVSIQKATLMTLEDLHWADSASVQLLHFLARNTERLRLLMIGTYRPEELAPGEGGIVHPLRESIRVMRREGISHDISLTPLNQEELRSGLEGLIGGRIDLDLLLEIARESEGNPLFAIESLRFLLQTGAITQRNGTWQASGAIVPDIPSTVREVILGRIEKLPEERRHLLEYAAVIGESFDPFTLEEALQLDRLNLLEALESIEKNFQLLQQSDGGYRFSHEKVRQAIYEEISTIRRRELHKVIAQVLERRPREESLYPQLSLHFYKAGEVWKTVKYSLIAGQDALERGAGREALELFQRVLSVKLDDPSLQEKMLVATEGLGDAYEALGLYEKALTAYADAMKISLEPRETVRILRKGGELPIGRRAVEFLDKAESITQVDPLEGGRIERIRAEQEAAAGHSENAFRHISEAQKLIEKSGSTEDMLLTLHLYFWLHISVGHVAEAREKLQRASELVSGYHGAKIKGWIEGAWGMFYLCIGDTQRALENAQQGIHVLSEYGLHSDLAQLYLSKSVAYYVHEDYESARREALTAVEHSLKTEYPSLQLWTTAVLTQVVLRLERLAEARQLLENASKTHRSIKDRSGDIPFYSWWLERHSVAYFHEVRGDYLASQEDWEASKREWISAIETVKTAVFGAWSEAFFRFEYAKYCLIKQGKKEDAKEQLAFAIETFHNLGNSQMVEKAKQLAEGL